MKNCFIYLRFYFANIIQIYLFQKFHNKNISRHSFAHIAQEAGAESSAIKNILGHSNLASTERYMGSFDTSKTDETLRNAFAMKQSMVNQKEMSKDSREELTVELLKGMPQNKSWL